MKGMMVTLLVILMTGTVIAQQPNQNDNAGKPGSFVLWLSPALINQLKTNPDGLLADVPADAKGKLVEVLLRYEKQHSEKKDSLPAKPGRFNLWLDDNLIQQLQDNKQGLVAKVPEPLQDKIMEVVLKYEASGSSEPDHFHPSTPQRNNSNAPVADRSISLPPMVTNSGDSIAKSDNRSNGWLDRSHLKNAFSSKGNSSSRPSDSKSPAFGTNQQPFGNAASAANGPKSATAPNVATNPGFRPSFNSAAQGMTSIVENDRKTAEPVKNQSDAEFQRELMRRETERLRTARIAQDRHDAQQKLADEKARYDQELYLQQMRNDSLARTKNDSVTPPDTEYSSDRYAMRSDPSPIKNPTYRFPNRRSESSVSLPDYDYSRAPSRQTLTTTPRVSKNVGLSGYRTETSGPNSDSLQSGGANSTLKSSTPPLGEGADHTNRANGFMFFMLMFSIGLNVYLAWISRGFYARYNELADELRETFVSSV